MLLALRLLYEGAVTPTPDPTPTPTPTPSTTTGGSLSSRRGIYTGRYIPREIGKPPKKLTRSQKRLIKSDPLHGGKPKTLTERNSEAPDFRGVAKARKDAEEAAQAIQKSKEVSAALIQKAGITLMELESAQLSAQRFAAQQAFEKEQEELMILLLIDDL